MTGAELAVAVFTACNMMRALAYVPQILCIARDRQGATAISYTTWSLFALSHLSTVAYALVALGDVAMILVFGANACACAAVLGLTFVKRRRAKAGGVSGRGEPYACGARGDEIRKVKRLTDSGSRFVQECLPTNMAKGLPGHRSEGRYLRSRT